MTITLTLRLDAPVRPMGAKGLSSFFSQLIELFHEKNWKSLYIWTIATQTLNLDLVLMMFVTSCGTERVKYKRRIYILVLNFAVLHNINNSWELIHGDTLFLNFYNILGDFIFIQHEMRENLSAIRTREANKLHVAILIIYFWLWVYVPYHLCWVCLLYFILFFIYLFFFFICFIFFLWAFGYLHLKKILIVKASFFLHEIFGTWAFYLVKMFTINTIWSH